MRGIKADFIDEHYYRRPEWFLNNAKRYDNYDRASVSKVFAGEYAGQSDHTVSINNKNSWRTAIAEAAFLTGLERNADVVKMASYAPLFAHIDGWQWTPNLIWSDNLRTMPTPNYQVQKLYATNKGSQVVPILYKNNLPATGQDSLYASATIDNATNELIIKIVNAAKNTQVVDIQLNGVKKTASKATLTLLQSNDLEAINTLDTPSVIAPFLSEIEVKNKAINTALKPYSFSVMRIKM